VPLGFSLSVVINKKSLNEIYSIIFGSWNLFINSLGVLLSTKWVHCSKHPAVGQETEECAENREIWAQ
jgi:hypothetical protein